MCIQEDMHFTSCGKACQPTCNDPEPVSTMQCVPGCQCSHHMVVNQVIFYLLFFRSIVHLADICADWYLCSENELPRREQYRKLKKREARKAVVRVLCEYFRSIV